VYTRTSFYPRSESGNLLAEDKIMDDKNKFDLKPFGQAVKEARTRKMLSREQMAEKLGISARHVQYIETLGNHPRLQVFFELATMLNISIDQFFFPEDNVEKTSQRRHLDAILDNMDENDLSVIISIVETIQAAYKNDK